MAKLKLDDIVKEVESYKWKLLSEDYQNLDSELEFRCPEGHLVYTSLKKWRHGQKCPVCDANPLAESSIASIPKNKNSYRVFAIDDSTHVSGWSIFDNSQLIKYGTFETREYDNTPVRITQVKQWIISMMDNWKPDLVAIEDIQLQDATTDKAGEKAISNTIGVTTFKTLAQLQGVLINYFTEKQIPYIVVPPATWRLYCKINGRTKPDKKRSAILHVKEWYDISLKDDAAEAICIGRYTSAVEVPKRRMITWGE